MKEFKKGQIVKLIQTGEQYSVFCVMTDGRLVLNRDGRYMAAEPTDVVHY